MLSPIAPHRAENAADKKMCIICRGGYLRDGHPVTVLADHSKRPGSAFTLIYNQLEAALHTL